MNENAKIISAFCGTGKTYLVSRNPDFLEFECWKYSDSPEFPDNICEDILLHYGNAEIIFISTNPVVISALWNRGIKDVTMIIPEISLKCEYLERFVARGSPQDFIGAIAVYWETWLLEASNNKMVKHVFLKSGQYIDDVLTSK